MDYLCSFSLGAAVSMLSLMTIEKAHAHPTKTINQVLGLVFEDVYSDICKTITWFKNFKMQLLPFIDKNS